MNKLLSLFLFISVCFTTVQVSAQRQDLKGKVISGDIALHNVFVINNTTKKETKTDANGLFAIAARTGDHLVVYSEGTEAREFNVQEDWFNTVPFLLEVKIKSVELNEVVVQGKTLNVEKMGIVPEGQKQYTPAQRRKRANRALSTNQGLNVSVDAIANKISGRSKTIKENVKTEDRMAAVDNFRVLYTNEEITDTFAIPNENVEGFLYFAVEDPDCLQALKANNRRLAKPHLQRMAKEYLKRLEEDAQQGQ